MGETRFQHLSVDERRLALRKAQAEGPHPAFLLEKDIWVVATLSILFEAPFGRHLVFSMLAIGMLLDEDEPFGTLMQRCVLIEERANAAPANNP